jgi:hypothetical protein
MRLAIVGSPTAGSTVPVRRAGWHPSCEQRGKERAMTDRDDLDQSAAVEEALGDPYADSTWNTLTGLEELSDLVAEEDLESFFVAPDPDPEGILAETTDRVAPDSPPLDPDRPDSARVDTSILPNPDRYPE